MCFAYLVGQAKQGTIIYFESSVFLFSSQWQTLFLGEGSIWKHFPVNEIIYRMQLQSWINFLELFLVYKMQGGIKVELIAKYTEQRDLFKDFYSHYIKQWSESHTLHKNPRVEPNYPRPSAIYSTVLRAVLDTRNL